MLIVIFEYFSNPRDLILNTNLALVFMLCLLLHVFIGKFFFIHFRSNQKVKVKLVRFANIKLIFTVQTTELCYFEKLNQNQSQS